MKGIERWAAGGCSGDKEGFFLYVSGLPRWESSSGEHKIDDEGEEGEN